MFRKMKADTNCVAVLVGVSVIAVLGTSSFAAGREVGGDPVRGAQIFNANCGACHSLDANRVGPALRGVYGRKAGTGQGYGYSPALRSAAIRWNTQSLDRWLLDPDTVVPGTRMRFRVVDPNRRSHVIAFLRQQMAKAN